MELLFDKFEIRECLKKDGGQCVYIAHHRYLGKTILLKTLDQQTVADPSMLDRFQREAKTLARLDHPNIIKVLDFGTFESFFYISFEFFDSRNLRAVLADDLTVEQKMHIFRRLVRGVDFAHQHNIIHRDLKPENILVNERLEVKIADFGLALIAGEASLTQPSSIVGTPSYMSPEQIRGEALTPQSDLFSLGIIAYELFIGDNPFLGSDVGSTINKILSKKVDCSAAPPAIAPLLTRLLKKNRSERLDSAQILLSLLPEEAVETPPATVTSPPTKRRLWPVAVLIVLILVLIALVKRPQPAAQSSVPPVVVDTTGVSALPEPLETDSTAPAPMILSVPPANPKPSTALLPGTLMVRCLPWAEVWIDGKRRDITPMESGLTLAPGDYELRLVHPKFPAYVQNIRIHPQEMTTVAVSLDTLFSFFSCRIYPWGEVYIDNEFLGVTPFAEPLRVMPGRHLLTVVNQEFGSVDQSFFVERQDTFHYHFNFEQLKPEQRQ